MLKNFFEDAGGSFIKFGQLLALRVEAIPNEYSLEMLDLLDNIRPFSYDKVQEIFVQELGATPEKIFKDFEKQSFASASFGQVHAAKLEDGTIVAVKILRPGIEETIEVDFVIIRLLGKLLNQFVQVEALSWTEFAEEFISWTRQEVDYHYEAENTLRMKENLTKSSRLVVPHVYLQYSTKRVLVQEYLEGMHLNKVLRGIRDGRVDFKKMKKLGVDIHVTPQVLIQELFYQYFFIGFFHGDPHPGNIILLPHNKIGLIDFGIVGESVAVNQKSLVRFLKLTSEFKFEEASVYFLDIAGFELKQIITSAFPATVNQTVIDNLMKEIAENYSHTVSGLIYASLDELKEQKKDYLTLFLEVFRTANKYHIKIPKESARFTRTVGILGLLGKQLDSGFFLNEEVKKFFKEYPENKFPHINLSSTASKRMSRELAIDKLNNWLAYLVEVDQQTYQIVNKYFKKYNSV